MIQRGKNGALALCSTAAQTYLISGDSSATMMQTMVSKAQHKPARVE